MRLIDADEFEKRIKPYDTEDNMDKALYNFAHYHLITTPSAQPTQSNDSNTLNALDCISRQAAIDVIRAMQTYKLCEDDHILLIDQAEAQTELMLLPPEQLAQSEMIKDVREWINSGNRGNADYFIVDKIEEIINKYER